MKSMKAMKAMKSTPKKVMKAMKGAPTAMKAKSTPLKKGNLAKLKTMSLQEKIKQIAQEHDDPVEAALVLKENMSAEEKTRAWNRHNKQLKKPGNGDEMAKFTDANKVGKGTLTALWLMKNDSPKWCTVAKQSQMEASLVKSEDWLSEKEALEKWGEKDLAKHCESGRVIWREASSHDVWEYMDTQAWSKKTTGVKRQSWQLGQEFQQGSEEVEDWDAWLDTDLLSMMNEFHPGKGKGKGTTPGKGKVKGTTPGKGKGKVKAIKDVDGDEDDPQQAIQKLRKARDLLAHTSCNYEEALEKVKKLGYLGKAALKEKETTLKLLVDTLQKVKETLVKGGTTKVDKLKALVVEGVKVAKDAKEETKELVQISMRTQSKASTKK